MVGRIPDAHERRPTAVRTFLIADIRGYTRFTAELGDEAGSRLATKFAQVMAEGIEAWGGTLVELRGDEALCVFDSARQALRAAVELQDAFADETRAEPHLPLTVGIGLDAGEAVPVGDGYRGAALNLAARLCAVSAAGEIRATQSLVHLAGRVDGLTYEPLGVARFKGIDEEVGVVLVTSKDATVGATGKLGDSANVAPPPLPPELESIVPLAGRLSDLRWLGWHWRRARHGHGRAVAISGPPGIGKTRLAAELAVTAHRDRAAVSYWSARLASAEWPYEAVETARPTLVVLEDLDAATPASLEHMSSVSAMDERPVLVLVTHGVDATDAVLETVERTAGPGRRAIGALDPEGVRSIAALYTERSIDELPLRLILEESDGIPAAIHRVASQWARSAVTRRLGASAERAAADRRELRASEEALIGDVTDLEFARERTRLYVAESTADDVSEPGVVICPYKGLAAFESVDTEYFFGRDRIEAELIARLVGSPFVGLVGASGSGKSSVLRAGLLPALASGVLPGSERWIQVLMRPGEHPLTELHQALTDALPDLSLPVGDTATSLDVAMASLASAQRLALVVDQFEELFTAPRDDEERAAFIRLLTTGRTGLKVIVALRADHYGHAAAYATLARLLGTDQVLVGPLDAVELASVIELPAQRVGLRVEPELTAALVNHAGHEPGALPLLSTALLELWQARDEGRLTLAAYQGRGGLRGAVARLAESAFADLTPEQQTIARSILLRLAGPGEGEGLVRRRVPLPELDAERDPAVAEVVDALTSHRLLTTGDGFVEVAHEALLREWPRLQGWLEEDAAGRQLRLHLIGAAREWDDRGREPGDLYRGARLAATVDWVSAHEMELNAVERAYVEAGKLAAEHEVERQQRTNRRLRGLLAGAAVFLVAAIGAGTFATFQLNRAEEEAGRAEGAAAQAAEEADRAEREEAAARAAEELARSRELAASAIAFLDDDPSLSKLLALAASSIADSPVQSVTALHKALAADPIVARYAYPEDRPISQLWAQPDPSGGLMVASPNFGVSVGSADDYLEVVDLQTQETLWSFELEESSAALGLAFFSHDGTRVIAGVYRLTDPEAEPAPRDVLGVHVWEAMTGKLVEHFDLGACGAIVTAVSEVSLLARTTNSSDCFNLETRQDVAVELIALDSGSRQLLSAAAQLTDGGALSRDGNYVAFDDLTGTEPLSVVVDTRSGERTLTIPQRQGQLDSWVRALNADGSLLLYGDRPIQVWDVSRRELATSFDGHAGESFYAEFGPAGDTVYSTGRDSTLRHWVARSGEPLSVAARVGAGRPAPTEGGMVMVTGLETASAALVDTRLRGEITAAETCDGFAVAGGLGVTKSLASLYIACDDVEGTTAVVDLDTSRSVYELPGQQGQAIRVSADGSRFVRQEGTELMVGPITVRDLRTGEEILELQGICTWDRNLVEPEETEGCSAYPEQPFPVWAWQLEWSPDGSMVAAVNQISFVSLVWDATTGRLLFADDASAFDIIFSPDSEELVIVHGTQLDVGLRLISTDSWQVTLETPVTELTLDAFPNIGFIGYSSDGTSIRALAGLYGSEAGTLFSVNAATLEVESIKERIHDGSPKSVAMSPNGELVATGSSDGFIRVWDATSWALVHEISVDDTQIQGLAFVNDLHLAFAPQSGNVYVVTIDTAELLDIARASLTRTFTPTECERFNFGDDCPTLEQLRNDSAIDG